MLIQGIVSGIPSTVVPDTFSPTALLQGKHSDLIVSELTGKYYTAASRGLVYHGATALAGVTLTTTGSTTMTFGLWNPAGSGKVLVPIKSRIGFAGATGTVTALAWSASNQLNANTAGTSAISAKTLITSVNGRIEVVGSASVGLLTSAATLAAAPTIVKYLGASWGAPVATTAAVFPTMIDDFDGELIIGPGSALWLTAATAPGAAVNASLSWQELPA